MKTTIATILLAAASCGAGAQTVYRCGSNYSQQPCEGAKTLQVDPSRRSFDGAMQARSTAQRDMKLADAMEKARLKEEARPVAAYIPKARPAEPASAKPRKPEVFTASVAGSRKPKKK